MNTHQQYTLEFELDGLPKMMNQLLRGHWRAKHGHTKQWKDKVAKACEWLVKPPEPLTRAHLTLVRCSHVEPDDDGLRSGFKPIVDALVEIGVLVDDKPSNIGGSQYLWEKAKPGKGKIKIKVESINEQTNEGEK